MTSQYPPTGTDGPPQPPVAQQPPLMPPQPQQYGQPHYPAAYPMQYMQPPSSANGLGIAGGVVGIVAAVFFWFPFLGLILGGTGLTMSLVGLQRANRMGGAAKGMAITGIVCGAVAVVLNLLILSLFVVGRTAVSSG